VAAGTLLAAPAASAQALPAAEASPVSTGFSIPTFGGSLNWAVSASSSLDWGYYSQSGLSSGVSISGDVGYLSESKFHPFSMVLTAGRSWGFSGLPNYWNVGLGLSQLINVGRWNFTISDYMSYLPETATGGVSGVVGVGDLGVPPVQVGPDSGQGVLTNYSPQIGNNAGASVQRMITGKTALNASGSYNILRYVDGPGSSGGYGLESDTVTGSGGFTHRLDARNSFGANYAYSSFIFLNNLSNSVPEPNFVSQTASVTYSRLLSRRFSLNLAAGPEWTKINLAQYSTSLNVYADAGLNYAGELARMGLSYIRSTNNGYGVTGGSLSDAVTFTVSRTYGRVWNTSANVAWTSTSSLPTPNVTPYDFKTLVAGFQVSRALARNLSAFASYTIEDQSHQSKLGTVDLFDGTNSILGLGVTYSPASRRFGRP
jgi:hypothetical protein